MEYKKIENKDYSIHLIKTDRFKLINVDVFFTRNFDKTNLEYTNLLTKMLLYTSNKYKTKNDFNIEAENLYNLNVYSRYTTISNVECFLYGFEFINPKYTEKCMYEKSFDYFKEVFLHPHVNDKKFNKEIFNINMNSILEDLNKSKENPGTYVYEQYKKNMYKGTPLEYTINGYKENYKKITVSSLYDFYKGLFTNYKIDIVVVGDYEEDILLNNINSIFDGIETNYKKIKFELSNQNNKKLKTIEEEIPFYQSQLIIGYDFDELSSFEKHYVLSIYNTILGTMNNSILFTKVREENSLCYSIRSSYTTNYPSITISAGINKDNKEKSLEEINKCMEYMKDKKEMSKLLDTAIKTVNTFLNNYYDNSFSMAEEKYLSTLTNIDDVEKRREEFNKITVDDIVNLSNKIHKRIEYFGKGIRNENN